MNLDSLLQNKLVLHFNRDVRKKLQSRRIKIFLVWQINLNINY